MAFNIPIPIYSIPIPSHSHYQLLDILLWRHYCNEQTKTVTSWENNNEQETEMSRFAQTRTRGRINYISVVGKLGTIGIGIWQV